MSSKPTLVIVSDWIRRDLQEPLRHFQNFEIVHLYRKAGYQDMKLEDFYPKGNPSEVRPGRTKGGEVHYPVTIQWQGMIDLWQKIIAAKPDILQGAEPWANRSSLIISLVTWWYKKIHADVKLIWPSMENRSIEEKFGWPQNVLLKRWAKSYGQTSDLVMYLNKGARENLIEAGVPEAKLKKVMWGTWGVDCGEFSPQSNSKLKTQSLKLSKEKIILFVGKVSEAKGVPWLLEAFEEVHEKFPDTKLVLAGPMDKNSNVKIPISNEIPDSNNQNQNGKIWRLDIGDSLELGSLSLVLRVPNRSAYYLGVVKNQNLPALFRQAYVVVAPSITTKIWEEQVGMVNLQAMACGVPVITTNSGAIPEFVKDGQGAILVPEKDAPAIADRLIDLLAHEPKRLELAQRARAFVVANYEVRENITKIERLLVGLLADRV